MRPRLGEAPPLAALADLVELNGRVARPARRYRRLLDALAVLVVAGDDGRARHAHHAPLHGLLDAQQAAALRVDHHPARLVYDGPLNRVIQRHVLVGPCNVEREHSLWLTSRVVLLSFFYVFHFYMDSTCYSKSTESGTQQNSCV